MDSDTTTIMIATTTIYTQTMLRGNKKREQRKYYSFIFSTWSNLSGFLSNKLTLPVVPVVEEVVSSSFLRGAQLAGL